MIKKIFKNTFFVSLVTFFVCTILGFCAIFIRFEDVVIGAGKGEESFGIEYMHFLIPKILVIFVIGTLLSALLASLAARRVVKPIKAIDPENPETFGEYEEIAPLLRRINHQNKMISEQLTELYRKQEEFSAITENMQEGFIIIDTNAEILSYNTAALHHLGYAEGEKPSNVFDLSKDESFHGAITNVLAGRNGTELLQSGNEPGSEEQIFEMIANPVFEAKVVAGAIIIIRNVTEREARETLRREFTSNVSHELKTPLTSIYGMSDLIAQNMVRSEDISQFGKNIHDETGRLISLVNDIIKISQLDEGILGEEKGEVDLLEVARSVISRVSAIAEKKQITIELEGIPAKVEGVQSIVEEMVYNLCDNAIKYNNVGGSVKVTIRRGNDGYSISVVDTGIGIPDASKSRVFERFYCVDKSHSKSIGGTGLGLSIVKHAAAYHNAKVELESHAGEGTRVTVRFPNPGEGA